ncbi:MAG: hypothetical protein NTW49_08820 [Bacteroidia bacterium]|nr:hypothetical protein [Bacteroidia bacterium]
MLRVKKRIAIPYQVISIGQVIEIREKLPTSLCKLTGVHFSAQGNFDSDIEHVGEISLEFCNRHLHPVNYHVGYTKDLPPCPVKFLPLNEPINNRNIMTGFYRDLSTLAEKRDFVPYRLTIYLKFLKK